MRDDDKDADPGGKIMQGLLKKIKSLGITYFFGKMNTDTDMVRLSIG
jgi:hypothetical protein